MAGANYDYDGELGLRDDDVGLIDPRRTASHAAITRNKKEFLRKLKSIPEVAYREAYRRSCLMKVVGAKVCKCISAFGCPRSVCCSVCGPPIFLVLSVVCAYVCRV